MKIITEKRGGGYVNHPTIKIKDLNFHANMHGVRITANTPIVGDWYEEVRFGGSGFNETISYVPLSPSEGEMIIIERLLGNFDRQSVQVMAIENDMVAFRYPQYDFQGVRVAHREKSGSKMSQSEQKRRK